jgi:uncharacterized RDD family membrane protein YckC
MSEERPRQPPLPRGGFRGWDPTLAPRGGPRERALENREELEAAIREGLAPPPSDRYYPPGRTSDRTRLSYSSAHEPVPVRGEAFPSFERRLVGAVIDLVALAIVWAFGYSGTAAVAVTVYVITPEGFDTYLAPAFIGLVISVPFWALWTFNAQGWSPAGRFTHLRAVDDRGAPPGARRGLLRTVAFIPSLLPLGIGFWAAAWNRDGQTWHDRIAGTRVIQLLR